MNVIGIDSPQAACLWDHRQGPIDWVETRGETSHAKARRLSVAMHGWAVNHRIDLVVLEKPFPREVSGENLDSVYEGILVCGWLWAEVERLGVRIIRPRANQWRADVGINKRTEAACKSVAMGLSDKIHEDLELAPRRGPRGGKMEHAAEAELMCVHGVLWAAREGLISSTGPVGRWRETGSFS